MNDADMEAGSDAVTAAGEAAGDPGLEVASVAAMG